MTNIFIIQTHSFLVLTYRQKFVLNHSSTRVKLSVENQKTMLISLEFQWAMDIFGSLYMI